MLDIFKLIEKKTSRKNFAYINNNKKFTYYDLSLKIGSIKKVINKNNIKNNNSILFK